MLTCTFTCNIYLRIGLAKKQIGFENISKVDNVFISAHILSHLYISVFPLSSLQVAYYKFLVILKQRGKTSEGGDTWMGIGVVAILMPERGLKFCVHLGTAIIGKK